MVGLRKIPGVAWRRMDGGVCLIRWETSKEAAASTHREMKLTGRRRERQELSRASQGTPEKQVGRGPEFRLGHDEGRGLVGCPGEVLKKQWIYWSEAWRETWAGDEAGLGALWWNGVGSFRVWLSSARESKRRARKGAHVKGGGPKRGQRSREGGRAGERHLEAQGMEICRRE